MKIIRKAIYSLMLFIILVVCAFSFLLTTTPGLYTAIRLGKLLLPGTLSLHDVTGRLVDEFSIEGLDYHYKNTQIAINQLNIKWDIPSWKSYRLSIKSVTADSITIKTGQSTQILNNINLTGHIDSEFMKLDALGFSYLNHPIAIQLQTGIESPHAITGTMRLNPAKQSTLKANLDIKGDLNHLRWSGAFHGPVEGSFIGNLMGNLNQGQITLTIDPGHYTLPENNLLSTLDYKGGTLKAVLLPKSLRGTGSLIIDKDKHLNLTFNLPHLDLAKGISANQPIHGQLELVIKSLDFLKQISPELSKPQGHLSATLNANGSLSKMAFDTQLHVSQASFSLPIFGLNLDGIDFKVIGKGKQWEADGTVSAANKKLFFKGKGPISHEIKGNISLEGSDFPLVNTREYQVKVSPKLNLKFTPSSLDITGSILVPNAHITPQTFTNSLTLSDDVIYKNKKESEPFFSNMRMHVEIEMGKEVELTLKGLQATLKGKVNVRQLPRGSINAIGELSVKKGQYKAYGQDLAIEQGQLIFTGGRLDNPGINLRASKKINNLNTSFGNDSLNLTSGSNSSQQANLGSSITAGVVVTGRLAAPKVQLFSNPSLVSKADILSLLVLGRPASEATKAGGQLLLTAITSMNLGKGTNGAQLLEQLKQSAGLDFNIKTTTNYNQSTKQFTDDTAVVVGKSLSKRIYLSYNVGLSQSDPNVLTLKYLLNKLFSIQVNTSTTSKGIDVLYSKEKKK